MNPTLDEIALPLFVPADRPERFGRAFSAGADAAILDLEDAVASGSARTEAQARAACRGGIGDRGGGRMPRAGARQRARTRAWHAADLSAVAAALRARRRRSCPRPNPAATVADAGMRRAGVRRSWRSIESARGLAAAREVAEAAARLAFGSIDLAADLGCAETRESLLRVRGPNWFWRAASPGVPGRSTGSRPSYGDAGGDRGGRALRGGCSASPASC